MDFEVRKQVLRQLTYGLYVLTAAKGNDIAAGTISWLSQASFNPPLVMVGVKVDSNVHMLIDQTNAFAINLLASDQKNIASAFFHPSDIGEGQINGYACKPGPETGAPLLLDAPAWFEGHVLEAVKRGDHTVFVAEIVSVGVQNAPAKPLVLGNTEWSYGG